ncbi:MAG: autotransporter-associated beta strand repeat-containing protein, partial [Planctomycetaceae bacterium]
APITIAVSSGSQTQLQTGNSVIRGTSPVTKTGTGTVIFDAANSTTGTTTIQAGILRVSHAGGLATSPTVVQGGRLLVDAGLTLRTPSLTLAGGTLSAPALAVNGTSGIGTLTMAGGQIAGTPPITISGGGRMVLSSAAAQTVSLSALTVNQSTGGRLDLGRGGVAVAVGGITAADLLADLSAGFAGGSWSGTSGIVSSAAAEAQAIALARTIGWADGGDGTLTVAFAAPGDTNLDGLVDLLDAANILSAGLYDASAPAIWSQGDFNYDATVDILDAADLLGSGLFDQGFYNDAGAAAVAAVPEPSGMVWLGLLVGLGAAMRVRPRR